MVLYGGLEVDDFKDIKMYVFMDKNNLSFKLNSKCASEYDLMVTVHVFMVMNIALFWI